ncbi:MAG: ribonuclease R [Planctomycetota bacterium]|nr:ribonuclease R [Planctomycetota bacterium]
MAERYVQIILKYLAEQEGKGVKPKHLARQIGVTDEEYGAFRESVKALRDAGRVVMGAGDSMTLPAMSNRVTGTFRANRKGFGFVIPDSPNSHGDLFISPEGVCGAMTGDTVAARVLERGKRQGKTMYQGLIVQIIKRGQNRFVGTLQKAEAHWFVVPEGRLVSPPIVIGDVGEAGPKEGAKVVVEIVKYAQEGQLPTGVIVESLGESGPTAVETLAVIRAYGLRETYPEEAQAAAREALEGFNPDKAPGREDLTGMTIVTIDPPDARDYDDAISITHHKGHTVLGVHIADVSHFVTEGTPLDVEARRRATSVYFPRKVLPMLPEVLSNGVCSLQEGQKRFCQSVFITYDDGGHPLSARACESVIRSAKRLTYKQAQDICDGRVGGYTPAVVKLVQDMDALARRLEKRRRNEGMLHLDLPKMDLVFDAEDRIVDAVPEDDAYTHTIIEMFMVEANEAVARLFESVNRPFLRRIHPPPDEAAGIQLSGFIRAAGHQIPRSPDRHDLQRILAAVKGKPESHAVNMAVLRSLETAEYSPRSVEHFALASRHYCHFTSPIRRYPDLTIHRLLADYCRKRLDTRPPEDMSALVTLGEDCSAAERRAEQAERELREVLMLQFLVGKVGESFDGVIVGVTNFGIFVEISRYGAEGLVRLEALGDDWWEVNARYGQIHGERTGRTYRIGDVMPIRIVSVDVAHRQMELTPAGPAPAATKGKKPEGKKPEGKRPEGKRPGGKKKNGRQGRNRRSRR